MPGEKLYVAKITRSNHASEEALNRRFHLVNQMPPVVCPVCGKKDNDWPERDGLCCNCWCAGWAIVSDAAPEDAKPTLKEVQKTIHRIVINKALLEEFAKKIRAYRANTGTLKRREEA
ncbi:MAG: hypothetical protein IJS08_15760 [Victivallales bacterium]|nr:hypothetical protein [Victivallales bacterium]